MHSDGHLGKARAKLNTWLDPKAWPKKGLSPVNQIVVAAIILATLIAIIETEPGVREISPKSFVLIEVVLVVVFLLEYFARVYAAGENPEYRGFKGRIRYILTPWAIVDLMAILPFILTLGGFNSFFLRVFRLLRLLRLAKLGRFSNAMNDLQHAISMRRHELMVSIMVAVFLLIITSSIIYVIEASHQPEAFGSIPRALWWSIATLTTVGYGDVTPVTALGQVFAGLTALIGIGMIAMPTGILAAAFSDVMQARKETDKTRD